MKKSPEETVRIKAARVALGRLIYALHTAPSNKVMSSRKVAKAVGLEPPNLKGIEDGVNGPSPEIYEAIVSFLEPDDDYRKLMDQQYSIIRGTPPPDVCKIICTNADLNNSLRVLGDQTLTQAQIAEVTALLTSFQRDTKEGAAANG